MDDFKIVSRHVIFWRAGKPSTKKYGGHSPWNQDPALRDYGPDEFCNSVKNLGAPASRRLAVLRLMVPLANETSALPRGKNATEIKNPARGGVEIGCGGWI